MENNHLTEDIIQSYLLKEISDNSITIHIAKCEVCKAKANAYKILLATLNNTKSETFSFDVTTLVINNIILYEKKKNKKQEFAFWGLLTFLVVVISSFSIPFIPKILAIFYSKSIFITLLVIGTGIIVLLFLLADIIQQYKTKEKNIFKNNLQPML